MQLEKLGWNLTLENDYKTWKELGFIPARVIAEFKNLYRIITVMGELEAQVTGKMIFDSEGRIDFPAVGDWVAISLPSPSDRGVIHHIFPRKSQFIRKMAGKVRDIQIIASNIDYAFIVSALDHEFNLRRMERYMTLCWESGASPVIVLNKIDICQNIEEMISKVELISMGAPIHGISCHSGLGFDELEPFMKTGMTVALLGSSGVGKSSIINYLLSDQAQKTNGVRRGDNHGRHTTTSRQLFVLPSGGMIIDSPGMRELQLYGSESSLEGTFEDITKLAINCKFANCQHDKEPGCAVREAIKSDRLDVGRLDSYRKQLKELRFISQKQNCLSEKNKKFKMISKLNKAMKKIH